MQRLSVSDVRHLTAAQGWLELGNHEEANEELNRIADENHGHPAVLELRWHVHAAAKLWGACLDLSRALMKRRPNDPEYWIWHGNSLFWSGQVREAQAFGFSAVERFPDNWTLYFNLACYCCQLGEVVEAKAALVTAMQVGESRMVKLKALSDPDLEPLWAKIEEL